MTGPDKSKIMVSSASLSASSTITTSKLTEVVAPSPTMVAVEDGSVKSMPSVAVEALLTNTLTVVAILLLEGARSMAMLCVVPDSASAALVKLNWMVRPLGLSLSSMVRLCTFVLPA